MEAQKEKRSLKYEFDSSELIELSRELANKTQEMRQLEEQRKSVVSEYTSKTNIAREQVLLLSDKVSSGYEIRDVECLVTFHEPTEGLKTIIRNDTGHTWTEKMTGSDYTLWNQYQNAAQEKKDDELYDTTNDEMVIIAGDKEAAPSETETQESSTF